MPHIQKKKYENVITLGNFIRLEWGEEGGGGFKNYIRPRVEKER